MGIIEIQKKGMLVILAAFVIVSIISPANAELEIVLDKLSPQPAEPGQDLVMSVRLVNEYNNIDNVKLTIVPDSPILLKDENDRTIDEGRIIKNGAIAETYLLHVDPKAVSGSYEVEFRAHWTSNDLPRETNKTFKLLVRGAPQLAISNITVFPELISPQDEFDLTFSVSNEGSGVAREVQVSAATGGLPFVPSTADTKIIKELGSGESSILNYRLQVKDRTEISSYSLPIKMEYKDENGTNISSQSFAGIKVLGKGKLSIENIKTEPQNPVNGDTVTVIMRIENSGTGDARSTKINVNTPFEGTKTAFLGKIKPNDDAPGVFTFYVNESGDIPYSATIEFEDDLGMHNITEDLHLFVRRTDKSGMVTTILAIVIAAGAIILYLYKKR